MAAAAATQRSAQMEKLDKAMAGVARALGPQGGATGAGSTWGRLDVLEALVAYLQVGACSQDPLK